MNIEAGELVMLVKHRFLGSSLNCVDVHYTI